MFERPHHQRIVRVLQALNADLLRQHQCLFGGGTAIALAHGEYRESVDIDFICSDVDGYRSLRSLVHGQGMGGLLRLPLPLARDPRIDQYGIRCAFEVDQRPIKFEIVFEGRVQLSAPVPDGQLCGVSTLAPQDQVATKLMANSDRWADEAVMSRDLIDLAMLTDTGALLPSGVAKAVRAYGDSVLRDLEKAKAQLLQRPGRLKLCMQKMGMQLPAADLERRLVQLRAVD